MALAIVLSGFNLGWLTAGPLAAWLIGRFGWRAAYVALGALIAAVGVPASLYVSYPESAEARHVTAGAGARWPAADRRLWYFVGAWGFLGFVYMMVTVHSVAYARDRGVPLEQASLALTAFGVGAIVGRLVAGAAVDHFGVGTTMRVCLVIQAAALVAFVAGLPAWAVPAALVVFGRGARRVRAGGAGHDHERGGAGLAQRRRARAGARGIRVRPDGLVHTVVRVWPRDDRRRLEVLPARQRASRALTGPAAPPPTPPAPSGSGSSATRACRSRR